MPQVRILQVGIDSDPDVVAVRQRARQISSLLGFGAQDQVRIATAVSEVARCAYARLARGRAVFALESAGSQQQLVVTIRADGDPVRAQEAMPGVEGDSPQAQLNNAVATAQRLMDECSVQGAAEQGLHVVMLKALGQRQHIDRERLRKAYEMKSRFLSNTSHELRTPLSSIRALSKLLLDRMDGELTVEQER